MQKENGMLKEFDYFNIPFVWLTQGSLSACLNLLLTISFKEPALDKHFKGLDSKTNYVHQDQQNVCAIVNELVWSLVCPV